MFATQRFFARFLIACALIATLVLAPGVTPTRAADQVVTNCSNDTELDADLAAMHSSGGGTLTFDCGPNPQTIPITSQKSINVNMTIDGGGKITLDGQNTHRLFDVGASLTLRNIALTRAYYTGDGGAIINRSNGTLILENSAIRNSTVISGSGGAIISYGPLTITNSLLEGNQAFNGGALYPRFSGARTVIVNSVLRDNHATDTTDGWGGAILAWDGAPVTIEGGSIYSNTARYGGGIYNYNNSVLQLTNVTLSGNSTDITGGGVYNKSSATLTSVTLSGNSAAYGGGIYNWTNSVLQLTNGTLSSNSASSTGGGLYNDGTATLTNVTLSGNSASSTGGGIFKAGGSVNVKNTIVANSPSGGNCSGGVASSGFNFSSDNSCSFGGGRDNVDVMLKPLANYGGPTLTHMPQADSPVIDNVTSGCPPPATDQRGAKRPFDGDTDGSARCDVGAVEYGSPVSEVYLPQTLRNYVTYFEGPCEIEPNNSYLQANGPLISGRAYCGDHDGTGEDRDIFYFSKTSGGAVTVNVTNLAGTAQVTLYDQSGVTSIGFVGAPPFTITCPGTNCTGSAAAAGTYYVRIFTPSGYGTATYTLTATFP